MHKNQKFSRTAFRNGPIRGLRQERLNGDIVVQDANEICRYIRVNDFEE
jgi:hypothetical protein